MFVILVMSVVVNKVLCYIQNNVHKHPWALLITAANRFFTDDEILGAKKCLFGALENLKPDREGLPRFSQRNPGEARGKRECENILNFCAFADERQLQLPTFVAANLERVPTVSPGDVDVFALAASVSSLTAKNL